MVILIGDETQSYGYINGSILTDINQPYVAKGGSLNMNQNNGAAKSLVLVPPRSQNFVWLTSRKYLKHSKPRVVMLDTD